MADDSQSEQEEEAELENEVAVPTSARPSIAPTSAGPDFPIVHRKKLRVS